MLFYFIFGLFLELVTFDLNILREITWMGEFDEILIFNSCPVKCENRYRVMIFSQINYRHSITIKYLSDLLKSILASKSILDWLC